MIRKFFKTPLRHSKSIDILFSFIESKTYYVLVVLFILLCFGLFIVSRDLPGGIRILTAKSQSMSPTITQGDLMVVQDKNGWYEKSDIVSFYAPINENPADSAGLPNRQADKPTFAKASGDKPAFAKASADKEEIVTHRILAVSGNVYLTKGDNNEATDAQNLKPQLIIGRVIMIIRNVGYLAVFLKSFLGQLVCVILPGVLFMSLEIFRLLIYFQQKRSQGHRSETNAI